MGAYVTAEEIQKSWLGDGYPDDKEVLEVWIGKAERLLISEVPSVLTRLDDEESDLLNLVKDIVTDMVSRKFKNPDGIRTTQDTTGPFSGSKTFAGENPGGLVLLPEERVKLGGAVRLTGGVAMSVDMTGGKW